MLADAPADRSSVDTGWREGLLEAPVIEVVHDRADLTEVDRLHRPSNTSDGLPESVS